MRDRTFRVLALATAAGLASAGRAAGPEPSTSAPSAVARGQALKAFDTIQRVLQHARCVNCHIPGDAPLQMDDSQLHEQNVKRGADGRGAPGLPCSTCHGEANAPASYGTQAPPGAPNWHLPPDDQKMVFLGLSRSALCATLKDPKRNGGRDLEAIRAHLAHDPLVLWGWSPGGDRAPVAVSHDALMRSVNDWIAGGAPCPAVDRGAAKGIAPARK